METDEIIEKQLKNMKRKMVSYIWEAPVKKIIELCLFMGIQIPKNLINKYISKDFD